jgi:hypothetical protein
MIPWLSINFKNFKPNAAIALNATRHMNKVERKRLFSPDIEPMRLPAVVRSNCIRDVSTFQEIGQIRYLARKADAREAGRSKTRSERPFLFKIRGYYNPRQRQDLAEFDMPWLMRIII